MSHTGDLSSFNEIVRSQSWVPTVGVGMKARLCAPTGMPQLLTMSATWPGSNRSTSFATRDVIRAATSMRVPSGARMCIAMIPDLISGKNSRPLK